MMKDDDDVSNFFSVWKLFFLNFLN
jgi:hypothetical protein